MVTLCLMFENLPDCFLLWLHHFTFSPVIRVSVSISLHPQQHLFFFLPPLLPIIAMLLGWTANLLWGVFVVFRVYALIFFLLWQNIYKIKFTIATIFSVHFRGIKCIQLLCMIVALICISLMTNDQRRQWHPTPVILPGESQGRGSLVGCWLWGRTESDTTEVT